MAELTTIEIAESFVGKRSRHYKPGWKLRREADALHMRGSYLVVRNSADVEHGLQVRTGDPWIVEEVEAT